MKKILNILLFFCTCFPFAMAQDNPNIPDIPDIINIRVKSLSGGVSYFHSDKDKPLNRSEGAHV